MQPLRWGILGAANIARKNWKAIRHSTNSVVAGVASRDGSRAREFVAQLQAQYPFASLPRVFADYDELLAAPEIDAVYIPLPTGLRKEWVERAARAGKHVLSEKPCGINAAELRAMLAVCAQHRVQFMDGVMFEHSNRLRHLRAILDDAARFGQLRRMHSSFSFLADPDFLESNIRTHTAFEPLGCLGDLGWYCIRLSLWAAKGQIPLTVVGHHLKVHTPADARESVPIEFSGELFFPDGMSSAFYCSFLAEMEQMALLIGTKACLELADFVLPFTTHEVGFGLREDRTTIAGAEWNVATKLEQIQFGEHGLTPETTQETNMFGNFAAQVRSGRLNPDWPAMALKTQLVLDACLASAQQRGVPVHCSG